MEFEEKNINPLTLATNSNSRTSSKVIKKFITAITCAAFLGLVSLHVILKKNTNLT